MSRGPFPISRERRRHVTYLARRDNVAHREDISDPARVMYIVGALVADKQGKVSEARLFAALDDEAVLAVAAGILADTRSAS